MQYQTASPRLRGCFALPVTVQGGAVTLVLFGTAGGGEVGDRGYVVPVQAVAAAQHEAGAGDPEDWPGQRGQGGG